jgi:hypothetical protein
MTAFGLLFCGIFVMSLGMGVDKVLTESGEGNLGAVLIGGAIVAALKAIGIMLILLGGRMVLAGSPI